MIRVAALASALALLACSGRSDEQGKRRLFSREEASVSVVFNTPAASMVMSADEASRRIGSFDWTAAVEWMLSREEEGERIHAVERHRVRQASTGEFAVQSDVDPGLGPGSETGKQVIYVGGMTYARSQHAPFGAYRERPTDRGRDARRYRDESFGLLADLAGLFGPALAVEPAGDGVFLDRAVKRYRLSLNAEAPSPASPAPRTTPPGGPDEDTRRHLAFLDGRTPLAASGELELDAQTGVPLRARLKATFGVKDDPKVRAQVELLAQMRAIGTGVAAVTAPAGALPDARTPPGVEGALEAAGLKRKADVKKGREEPGEEGEQ